MIRRHLFLLRSALMFADALSAFVLFWLIATVRYDFLNASGALGNARTEPAALAAGYALLWVVALWFMGLYRLRTHWSLRGEVVGIVRAGVLVAFVSLSVLFLINEPHISRLFLLMLFVAQPVVTIGSRLVLRELLTWMRSRGYNSRQMLIVGAGPAAERFANEVERQRELGLRVMGHLPGPHDERPGVSRPVLGSIDKIEEIMHRQVVDEVAICLSPAEWSYVEPATRICEEEGKIVRVVIPPLGGLLTGGHHEQLADMPVVTFLYGPDRVVGMALKRAFDIVVSAFALVVLSPLILGVALAIGLIDGPPVVFRHRRVGLHGRPFDCLKFRTMIPGAEEMQSEFVHLNDMGGAAFKIADDPRVTRLGRLLRRFSLDELPQLVNVLRGEMSIVGPRPAPPREVENYSVWHRRRLSMRPGLTGLWQVVARTDGDFDRRATLDLNYVDSWSLWMDLKIMLRTIPAVFLQQGR
ncbi:MAG: sugar transferase [Chloroflexota bacterium]|nr:sugar transferase [Chloroflexota bacterium]